VVRAERGLAVIWTGFGIASLALAWRLLLYRRELILEWSRDEGGAARVRLAGRSDYYRALFEDELARLVAALERDLGGPAA
jgi:hypothetical protein